VGCRAGRRQGENGVRYSSATQAKELDVAGYTVIDLETTGLFPKQHDRIVEIGVVYVSAGGQVEGEWGTLVNPGRDVGPTHIHGLTARDVIEAPRFGEIAPHVLRSVAGRTIVAHNSRFDTGFLAAEFARAGVPVGELPLPSLCTMELAPQFYDSRSRRLVDCCSAAGVQLDNAHSALGDARATAQLLGSFIARCGRPEPWWTTNARCAGYPWPTYSGQLPEARMVQRTAARERRADAWLDGIVARMPRVADAAADSYLEVLGRALVEQYLSLHEQQSLVGLAADLGLSRQQVNELHGRYLDAMGAVALADGVVTAEERRDLERVAGCLGLDGEALARSLTPGLRAAVGVGVQTIRLEAGDRVVITGDTKRSREDWIDALLDAGLEHGGVTKKTRVVVASDPDSLSGKAEKARAYGVPIITESAFERIFEEYCRSSDG